MIKKFNEHSIEQPEFKDGDIRKIITQEDIEDLCLRLKEILNCDIRYNFFKKNKQSAARYVDDSYIPKASYAKVDIRYPAPHTKEFVPGSKGAEIQKEIIRIKHRIESMFPSLYIKPYSKTDIPERNDGTFFRIGMKSDKKTDLPYQSNKKI
jgi:hypothetical protein